jgi:hypothetical protein
VPPAELQTLMTLNPATVTTDNSLGDRCRVSVHDSGSSGTYAEVSVRRHQTAEQIRSDEQEGVPGIAAHGTTPGDEVIVFPNQSGKAVGVHDGTVATIDISDADASALISKSYAYRLQRAALQAAGATVTPAPEYGADPVAQQPLPPAPPSLWDRVTGAFGPGTITVLILVLVFVVMPLLRRRNRQRLLATGLPGTALITAVHDTGVTVNNNPRVRFDVMITPATGMPAFAASTTKLLSRLVAPTSMIGTTHPVRYDPNNAADFIFTEVF